MSLITPQRTAKGREMRLSTDGLLQMRDALGSCKHFCFYSIVNLLKLKLQYFGHLMRRNDLLEKTLILGMIEGRKRRGHQGMRCLDGITD